LGGLVEEAKLKKGKNHGGGQSNTGQGHECEVVNAAWAYAKKGVAAEEYHDIVTGGFTPEQVQGPLSLIETPNSRYAKLSGEQNWLSIQALLAI